MTMRGAVQVNLPPPTDWTAEPLMTTDGGRVVVRITGVHGQFVDALEPAAAEALATLLLEVARVARTGIVAASGPLGTLGAPPKRPAGPQRSLAGN